MKLSIIVPVFNVEEYLDRCITSIINQTYKDIEIILVNDGSTDDSLKICKSYAEKDNRIKIIDKQNCGAMSACKDGLIIAEGEYVGFVDSDDYIDENMYEILMSAILKDESDIVVCGVVRERVKAVQDMPFVESGVYFDGKMESEIFNNVINMNVGQQRCLIASRCNKVYTKELVISNMKYFDENLYMGEDLNMTIPIILDCKKIMVLREFCPYHYMYNEKSITGGYIKNCYSQAVLLYNNLCNIIEEKNRKEMIAQVKREFYYACIISIINEIKSKRNKKEKMSEINKVIHDKLFTDTFGYISKNNLSLKEKVAFNLLKKKNISMFSFLYKLFNLFRK